MPECYLFQLSIYIIDLKLNKLKINFFLLQSFPYYHLCGIVILVNEIIQIYIFVVPFVYVLKTVKPFMLQVLERRSIY